MYQIIKDGLVLDYADEILFIRMQSNGSYGPCEEAEATGIAANSVPYHLEGRPNTGMEDLPTVSYLRVSAAKLVTEQEARLYALEGAMLAIMEVEMDV